MKKIIILVSILFFTSSVMAEDTVNSTEPAPSPSGKKKGQGKKKGLFSLGQNNKPFTKMDKNKDGFITIDEMQSKPMEMFSKHDLNKDGTVTKAELQASIKNRFNEIDTDKDSKLSPEESKGKLRLNSKPKPKAENPKAKKLIPSDKIAK